MRIGTASAIAILVLLTSYSSALADPPPDPGHGGVLAGGQTTPGGASAYANNPAGTVLLGGGGGGGASTCTWLLVTDQAAQTLLWSAHPTNQDERFASVTGPPAGQDPTTGTWYAVSCPGQFGYVTWVPPGGPAKPTSQTVAQQAFASIHFDPVAQAISPATATIVRPFATWLAVSPDGWKPKSATATAGGVSATVTATPTSVEWNPGDGSPVIRCQGSGTLYQIAVPFEDQHTTCSYAYPKSSGSQPGQKYTIQATVIWHVSFTATGAAVSGGDLGDVRGDPATALLEVDEVHAVNVPPGS